MLYYVERSQGRVIAAYARPQPGRTDPEPLPETDPALQAFFSPPPDLDDYRVAVRAHIDSRAQERQYDGAQTCATYVASTNPVWAAEAQAFVVWRDTVWGYAFAELAKVHNGQRPQPSIDEFIAELPGFSWPNG